MKSVKRGLLQLGNSKLSRGIWHFSITAGVTCPGQTNLCARHCYAKSGRFVFSQTKKRLAWNYTMSKREDFTDKMVDELFRNGVLVCRIHVSGDHFSPGYARKWLDIVRRATHTTFFCYTRSYRVPQIESVLREMALLPNMMMWYSADAEAQPTEVPEGVRVAWMQTEEDDPVDEADLVFRIRSLRKLPLPLVTTVCPQETPQGHQSGLNCAVCKICWTD